MKIRSLALVAAAFIVTAVATPSFAMYHAGMGRFMQRDPHGTMNAPTAPRVGMAGPAAAGGFVARDPMPAQPQPGLQYADGMNLYQYVGSNPILFRDPMGMWRYVDGMGTLSGQLGPGAKGPATSDFHLTFNADREAFKAMKNDTCCSEIRFVQILYVDTNKATLGRGRILGINATTLPLREWTLDADTPPYYPHGNWRDPRSNRFSSMFDTPGLQSGFWKINNLQMDFEVCAVCSKSFAADGTKGVGDVFGCLEWGHSFGIKGPIWNRRVDSWKRYVDKVVWGNGMRVKIIKRQRPDGTIEKIQLGGGSGQADYIFKNLGGPPSQDMKTFLDKQFPNDE
jgi:hypothetical protein